MSAYLVAIVQVIDPEKYKNYVAAASVATKKYGGRYIARGGDVEALENFEPGKRVVVIEFDGLEQAKAWYDSPEYQAAKLLRQGVATGEFFAVEGC